MHAVLVVLLNVVAVHAREVVLLITHQHHRLFVVVFWFLWGDDLHQAVVSVSIIIASSLYCRGRRPPPRARLLTTLPLIRHGWNQADCAVLVDGREWHTVDTTTTSEWWAAGSDDVGFRWRLAAIGRVAVNVVGDGGLEVHLAAEGERSSYLKLKYNHWLYHALPAANKCDHRHSSRS